MVAVVKYRKALLTPEIEQHIRYVLHGITERYQIAIDEVGFDEDHIHLFCGAKPTLSPMKILSTIKSITARMTFARFPALRQELWGGEFWSDGKYIGTIGDESNEATVRKYIQNQGVEKETEKTRLRQLRLFKI